MCRGEWYGVRVTAAAFLALSFCLRSKNNLRTSCFLVSQGVACVDTGVIGGTGGGGRVVVDVGVACVVIGVVGVVVVVS